MIHADRRVGDRKRGSSGFTLIETLCALSILALCLAGVTQLCTDALRARVRADHVEAATEFLESLTADMALNQPYGVFDAASWVALASKKGWRLEIQSVPMSGFDGLLSVNIMLDTGHRGAHYRLNRIRRGPES